MRITVINGTEKKGVTYRMKELFLEHLKDEAEITELSESVQKKVNEIPGVQIFTTTHNTDLMSNDFLRPDCYFLLKDACKKMPGCNYSG